jgi:phosphoglycerol transferase MdoB-like AlkP superfamily enzyme
MWRLTTAQSLFFLGRWLQKLLLVNFIYILVMAAFRLANWLLYGQHSPWSLELLHAFWMGFRFDSVVLGYVLTIPSIYLILALNLRSENLFQKFPHWVRGYYLFFFSLIGILLALDTQYYSYFQDHFNILVFALFEDDTWALLRTFWKNYPVLWYLFFTILGIWGLRRFLSQVIRPVATPTTSEKFSALYLPVVSLLLIVLLFFMGRGSLGLFPLGQTDTVISRDPFLNHLSSNGIYALQRAFKLRRQQNQNWDSNLKNFGYSDAKQAFADFYQIPVGQVPENPLQLFHQKTPPNPWALATKPHVIVIVMESFGGYWIRYHSPQFNLLGELEKHMQDDTFLQNFLPATGSTVGSLSSLMISAPHRPIGNFLTESEYLQVPFRSSPARIFAKAGYETRFIYGGNPGWRDMNKFARYQGFQHVEGDVDIQAKLGAFKETHDWGIYDEDLFRYVKTILQEATKPQMLLVMTTTNHPPYQVPLTYKAPAQTPPPELANRLVGDPKIIESRFRTYLYSSQKLGEFLTDLKSSPLKDKTILAATGDHGFWLVNFTDEEQLQKWTVPLYLYAPPAVGAKIPKSTFGSHMDIFPTLYNLALSDTEYDALGVNLADAKAPHYAFNASGLAVGPDGGAMVGGVEANYYAWKGNFEKLVPTSPTPALQSMVLRYRSLMSLLDYYFMSEKKMEKH